MIIRTYQTQDLSSVLEIMKANIPTFFAAEEYQELVSYLEFEREDYFVVENKGRLIGAGGINYFPTEKEARISWDFIAPSEQGNGIGKALLKYRLSHIKQHTDYKKVIVRTSQVVYPFYEKMGFVLKTTTKDYWAKGFDLYHMEQLLQ